MFRKQVPTQLRIIKYIQLNPYILFVVFTEKSEKIPLNLQ